MGLLNSHAKSCHEPGPPSIKRVRMVRCTSERWSPPAEFGPRSLRCRHRINITQMTRHLVVDALEAPLEIHEALAQ